jgi:hypothetical protein
MKLALRWATTDIMSSMKSCLGISADSRQKRHSGLCRPKHPQRTSGPNNRLCKAMEDLPAGFPEEVAQSM